VKFNLLDATILAVMAFGVWRGFIAGLIRELSQLFGLFLGFVLAVHLMKPAGLYLTTIINNVEMPVEAASLFSFVFILLLVYVIVYILARFFERVADGVKLGPANKLFGGVFGGAKSALVLSILLVFFGQVGLPGEKAEAASYLHAPVERLAPQAWVVFSRSVPMARGMTSIVGERFWSTTAEETEEQPGGGPVEN
jgi:uncharacterized membrane protein required for colicin V production